MLKPSRPRFRIAHQTNMWICMTWAHLRKTIRIPFSTYMTTCCTYRSHVHPDSSHWLLLVDKRVEAGLKSSSRHLGLEACRRSCPRASAILNLQKRIRRSQRMRRCQRGAPVSLLSQLKPSNSCSTWRFPGTSQPRRLPADFFTTSCILDQIYGCIHSKPEKKQDLLARALANVLYVRGLCVGQWPSHFEKGCRSVVDVSALQMKARSWWRRWRIMDRSVNWTSKSMSGRPRTGWGVGLVVDEIMLVLWPTIVVRGNDWAVLRLGSNSLTMWPLWRDPTTQQCIWPSFCQRVGVLPRWGGPWATWAKCFALELWRQSGSS